MYTDTCFVPYRLSKFRITSRIKNSSSSLGSDNEQGAATRSTREPTMKASATIAIKAMFLIVATSAFSHAVGQVAQNQNIDQYIAEAQNSYNVPGVALAVIKSGRVVHKQYYGNASLDFSVPVDRRTLFPVFSTTKVFSTVAVHQLIEQNRLRLDDKASKYVEGLPAAWRNVQIQHLLAHTSGLPDIVTVSSDSEADAQAGIFNQAIRFRSGQRFEYNQTNYWMLSKICEKAAGRPLCDQVLETQFKSEKKTAIFEGDHAKIVRNQATVYDDHERRGYLKESPYHVREYLYGASGLSLTLDAFLNWEKKFAAGTFLSDQQKSVLQKRFPYIEESDFTYGLKLHTRDDETSFGMTGSAASAYRYFPDRNLTIILLANGMFIPTNELNGIDEVVDGIAQLFPAGN